MPEVTVRTRARNLALAGVSTALALLAAEAMLRAEQRGAARCDRLAERAKCRAARAAGIDFDARTRLEVLDDLAREGRSAWPGVKPAGVIAWGWPMRAAGRAVVPLGGLARALTVYCNESGEWISFESDEHGFRNPPGLHAAPLDVAILGDSFAQGYCVGDRDEVAARVRERRPRALNLGVDGNGPLLELATLREFAAPLEPRAVVWLFHPETDPEDLAWEASLPALRAYLEPGHRLDLRASQVEIDAQLRAHLERERRGRDRPPGEGAQPLRALWRLDALRARAARLAATREPDPLEVARAGAAARELDEALLRRVLAVARDEVRGWGGELVFVRLAAFEDAQPGAQPPRARVIELASELGLAAIDLAPRFAAQRDPARLFPFGLPGHYTAQGYALVAEEILGALEARAAH
jgi:hypothetical protein